MIAYVASYYLTLCLHITPMQFSGKVIDLFMLLEYKCMDFILLGLFKTHKKRIMSFNDPSEILGYFKMDLMKESLRFDQIGAYLDIYSLKKLLVPEKRNQRFEKFVVV